MMTVKLLNCVADWPTLCLLEFNALHSQMWIFMQCKNGNHVGPPGDPIQQNAVFALSGLYSAHNPLFVRQTLTDKFPFSLRRTTHYSYSSHA